MLSALKRHSQSRGGEGLQVEVRIERLAAAGLALSYRVSGGIQALSWPAAGASRRTDELWRRTCLEAFLQTSEPPAYYEFNFAPSTAWAAYRFDGYRMGMSAADLLPSPRIQPRAQQASLELDVVLDLSGLPDLLEAQAWRLGISAVLEEADGAISYWALAHPPGKADFHHPDGFVCDLPPEAI